MQKIEREKSEILVALLLSSFNNKARNECGVQSVDIFQSF